MGRCRDWSFRSWLMWLMWPGLSCYSFGWLGWLYRWLRARLGLWCFWWFCWRWRLCYDGLCFGRYHLRLGRRCLRLGWGCLWWLGWLCGWLRFRWWSLGCLGFSNHVWFAKQWLGSHRFWRRRRHCLWLHRLRSLGSRLFLWSITGFRQTGTEDSRLIIDFKAAHIHNFLSRNTIYNYKQLSEKTDTKRSMVAIWQLAAMVPIVPNCSIHLKSKNTSFNDMNTFSNKSNISPLFTPAIIEVYTLV